jgi:hypothetical protein
MRPTLAALTDGALAAVLGYLGFRAGLWSAPCSDQSNCFILMPLCVGGALLALALYFGLSFWIWRSTPGRRLLGVGGPGTAGEDVL